MRYTILLFCKFVVPDQNFHGRQVVGQLGMWGTIINGIQASALEHDDMTVAPWTGITSELSLSQFVLWPLTMSHVVGLLVAYTVGMWHPLDNRGRFVNDTSQRCSLSIPSHHCYTARLRLRSTT